MDEIRALQIGAQDWNQLYRIPPNITLTHAVVYKEQGDAPYDLMFWDRAPEWEELGALYRASKAYTLFVPEDVALDENQQALYTLRMGKRLARSGIQEFFSKEARFYFPNSYGEKYRLGAVVVSPCFQGGVRWHGNQGLELSGDFGKEYRQAVCWRTIIPVFPRQVLDLWLEYKKTPGVDICLEVHRIPAGSTDNIIETLVFTEEDLRLPVQVTAGEGQESLFMSLKARGKGRLFVAALHSRYSRGDHGVFLPGGERFVTAEREEVFCYFDPMDGQPPLNVYFSGYRTQEGFEGYRMMRSLGCPFLLVADQRLEGGAFYMGSKEYEDTVTGVIRRYMRMLGFGGKDVVMSGLSMGTAGALYHGCAIHPRAMVLGKPLAGIGTVAEHEKYLRAGAFPTSLDVLAYQEGGTGHGDALRLDRKLWDRFAAADWKDTKFFVSYMIEDDYDAGAYARLLSCLTSGGAQVIGKGYHGRHNDNTGGIVRTFTGHYRQLLREDFGRS